MAKNANAGIISIFFVGCCCIIVCIALAIVSYTIFYEGSSNTGPGWDFMFVQNQSGSQTPAPNLPPPQTPNLPPPPSPPNPKTPKTPPKPGPVPNPGGGGGGPKGVPVPVSGNAILDFHNESRAKHGAAPLVWDAGIAAHAQGWANSCSMVHMGGSNPYGENLTMGYIENDLVGPRLWYSEVAKTTGGPNDAWITQQAGHWTQMVWKDTKRLGCATAQCGPGNSFQVCHYDPPGNWVGGGIITNVQK